MNRVLELESNHTLYEQYMAQQQFLVREALKRLGEDIGRLEGVVRCFTIPQNFYQFKDVSLLIRERLTDKYMIEQHKNGKNSGKDGSSNMHNSFSE